MQPHELDKEFEERTLTSVEKHADGSWTILSDGMGFGCPADSPIEPKAGMVARYYGKGFGYQVHGLMLDEILVFYKTVEQRETERAEWLAAHEEKKRLTALEPKLPVPQIEGFEWTEDMHEISGFGGGYERACRAMVSAGCKWLTDNPQADPQFHGFKGIYGVLADDNEDAKALSKVVTDAADGGASGTMHQATIGHIMFWKRDRSWTIYQAEMRKERKDDAA